MRSCIRLHRLGSRLTHSGRGCRLLDYTKPETHIVVPRQKYLLGSRAGHRYNNNYDETPELITIYYMLKRKHGSLEKLEQWPTLKSRLGREVMGELTIMEPEKIHQNQESEKFHHPRVWAECALARDLESALGIMKDNAHISWPAHITLYTFARHCPSALVAYHAIRQFETILPHTAQHMRLELTAMALQMVQRRLRDFMPVVIELFLANSSISAAEGNELLWRIAKYGTKWDSTELPLLADAQGLVVQAMGISGVDSKGLFALAYIEQFQNPQRARRAMAALSSVAASRSPDSKEFAYTCGRRIIELMGAENAESALAVLDTAANGDHTTALWTAATQYLVWNDMLTPGIAERLFRRALKNNVRLPARFIEHILGSLPSLVEKSAVLSIAQSKGLKVTPAIVSAMARVHSASDLAEVQHMFKPYMANERICEQVLRSQVRIEPTKVWETYSKLKQPGVRALTALCRAAWDPKLLWGDMYAAQRAMAEVRLHVRGLSSPPDDVLRVFPDIQLLYAYVVMTGRSNYNTELLEFLPWMVRLGIEPPKRTLLALIHYSPQGAALLKLGKARKDWPTEEEYELYRQML